MCVFLFQFLFLFFFFFQIWCYSSDLSLTNQTSIISDLAWPSINMQKNMGWEKKQRSKLGIEPSVVYLGRHGVAVVVTSVLKTTYLAEIFYPQHVLKLSLHFFFFFFSTQDVTRDGLTKQKTGSKRGLGRQHCTRSLT